MPKFINKQVRVWDLGVRIFHWSLVTMFASAYFLAENRWLHIRIGNVVLGLMAFRIVWGFVGGKHARFKDFVPSPLKLLRYLWSMLIGKERRYLGHNPAGGAMIIALLITITSIGVTGYMIGMDRYFGVEWVEHLHKLLVKLCLILLVGHVGGVIFSSYRHKENLVKAMVTGNKQAD